MKEAPIALTAYVVRHVREDLYLACDGVKTLPTFFREIEHALRLVDEWTSPPGASPPGAFVAQDWRIMQADISIHDDVTTPT